MFSNGQEWLRVVDDRGWQPATNTCAEGCQYQIKKKVFSQSSRVCRWFKTMSCTTRFRWVSPHTFAQLLPTVSDVMASAQANPPVLAGELATSGAGSGAVGVMLKDVPEGCWGWTVEPWLLRLSRELAMLQRACWVCEDSVKMGTWSCLCGYDSLDPSGADLSADLLPFFSSILGNPQSFFSIQILSDSAIYRCSWPTWLCLNK